MIDISFSISGAAFEDGSTVTGMFTVSYGDDGAITAISGSATVKGEQGETTFTSPYALSYANPTSDGAYEITFPCSSGQGYAGLYLDWNGQNPARFNSTSTFPYSSVKASGANGAGEAIRLADGGHANIVRSFDIAGATFEDGSTVAGAFTVAYDPTTGAIVSIEGSATVDGPNGHTTFTKPYVLSYADPNPHTGTYEITFPCVDGKGYDGLYLDWNGEDPAHFNSTSTFPYSSVKVVGPDGTSQPIRLVNGGQPADLPCFAAGTAIDTPRGPVAVEALREGDSVLLAGGGTGPGGWGTVRWVGSRGVRLDGHRRPEQVLPVRIRAGALADGVPARDLLLSPDHALLLDGMLIPAKVLVNGASITQDPRSGSIRYHHVMLDAHAPLLAEGAAAESFLDIGEHGVFGPQDGHRLVLHPAMAQRLRESWSFAPLRERGPAVERVRARLLARTKAALSTDAAFRVRRRGADAVLCSRTAVPAEIGPCPEDRRVLGVKVAAIRVDGVSLPLDHPALQDGWYATESDGRWTNGAAVVPGTLLDGGELAVELAATLRYRTPSVPAVAVDAMSRNGERG
ncbi:MAG: Hint domain-containing protein [Gluconacetobacter diazotrophicus]|nr:Hint domain-containing protein [Gluconacetobacter diazotrophicus]